jgi:RNA 2',3'-cyclic 3'-phosphodiesterase
MKADRTSRVFIAIATPSTVGSVLRAAAGSLASSGADVAWVSPDQYHCTLFFLGEVADEDLGRIGGLTAEAAMGIPQFEAAYRGIGFFPTPDRARVVWAGMHDDGSSRRLHDKLAAALKDSCSREERPDSFHPHVTLGRIRSPRNLRRLITSAESITFDHPPVAVREITIVKSDLRPAGPVYTALRSIPLSP